MKVLVYGTLKSDQGNSDLLHDSTLIRKDLFLIENCSLRADVSSPFPYLYRSDITAPFIGELYEVGPETLKHLDNLEGHPSFYTRVFIGKYDCYTYVFNHDDAEDLAVITNFGE